MSERPQFGDDIRGCREEQACVDHDPDRASLELHNHLARTANMIAGQMGGRSDELFELLPGGAESEKAAVG